MSTLVREATRAPNADKAMKIIARSLFRELRQNGYESRAIVSLSSELISLVTSELRAREAERGREN